MPTRTLVGLALVLACGPTGPTGPTGPCEVAWSRDAAGTAERLPNLGGDEATGELRIHWPPAEPAERVLRYRVVQGGRLLAEVDAGVREAVIRVRHDAGLVRVEACDRSDRCTAPDASLPGIHLVVDLIVPPVLRTDPPPNFKPFTLDGETPRVRVIP